MSAFFIIRLGKDSVKEIQTVDALKASPTVPLEISISCAQVPKDFAPGSYAFICLGSDNNKGTPTAWVRGLRAFGTLKKRQGGASYQETQILRLSITTVLQRSITPKDFLASSPAAYYWFSDIPVIGVNTFSNQTVQEIDVTDPNQDVRGLLYAIEAVQPGFKAQVLKRHNELTSLFDYTPPAPETLKTEKKISATDANLQTSQSDLLQHVPADWVLALAAKGFLLVSGPSGTGKSRTARDIGRLFDYPLESQYAATVNASRPAASLAFVPVGADWTDGTALLGFKNSFGPPRTVVSQDGTTQITNELWASPSALRLILRAHARPDQPHFLILDEMNLSHVERYFSDFLSVMESNRGLSAIDKFSLLDGESTALISGSLEATPHHPLEAEVAASLLGAGKGITFPDNLYVIGTVNVDETTYMFSPKVLDRAHVLELKAPVPSDYLQDRAKPLADAISVDRAKHILTLAAQRRRNGFWDVEGPFSLLEVVATQHPDMWDSTLIKLSVTKLLNGLQKLLKPIGFGFGLRTINEVCAYLTMFMELDDPKLFAVSGAPGWVGALDRAVLQKVLPKIHGSRRHLGTSLTALIQFCDGAAPSYKIGREQVVIAATEKLEITLPLSAAKLGSMISRLEATGYTTFVS
jgi:hypothetical protein